MLGDTVLAMPEDAGVVRIAASGLGVALATDGNGRYTRLDPYAGAQLALAEAYRNVAATGATPVAVTNCLNFGSPEDPEVMWQFAEACRGLADGCLALGTPVTGGNVSFYNQTGTTAINPTPVVGVVGHHRRRRPAYPDGVLDGRRRPAAARRHPRRARRLGVGVRGARAPRWPPAGRRPRSGAALAEVLVAAAREGLLTAAHDLSDGGLAQALVESCLRGGHGARVVLPSGADPFVTLWSESAGRAVVALPAAHQGRFAALCTAHGLPCTPIGVVGGDAVEVQEVLAVSLAELRTAAEATLPALFGP